MNSERELETKEQLFEAVDFICADGLIGTTGKSFTADKLKRSINANVVTRRYGSKYCTMV